MWETPVCTLRKAIGGERCVVYLLVMTAGDAKHPGICIFEGISPGAVDSVLKTVIFPVIMKKVWKKQWEDNYGKQKENQRSLHRGFC